MSGLRSLSSRSAGPDQEPGAGHGPAIAAGVAAAVAGAGGRREGDGRCAAASGPVDGGAAAGLWLACAALGWLAGLAVQMQQAALAPESWRQAAAVAAVAAVALAGGALRRAGRGGARLVAVALALAAAALGWASTEWRAAQRLAQRLPAVLEGQPVTAVGRVVALPQAQADGWRFLFEVESARDAQGRALTLPPRLWLGWYPSQASQGDADPAAAALAAAPLRAGERWQLPLRLKRPHAAQNPGLYDAELGWFAQDIGAVGAVRAAEVADPPHRLAGPDPWRPALVIESVRQRLREAIERQVPSPLAAGVLAALVVGDQSGVDQAAWELYRQTGVAHVIAISGTHITMLAWLASVLALPLWRRQPAWALRVPAPLAARWIGVAVAAAYALLAGWGVPAQRTVLMLAVAAGLRSTAARWPWWAVLLSAAVAVTALNPWSLMQAGFWLSFAAVGLLLASEPVLRPPVPPAGAAADTAAVNVVVKVAARGRRLRALVGTQTRAHLRSQWVATAGLAPLSLLCFHQLSLIGWLANLVAIPLVTLLITPLALLGILVPPLWTVAAALVVAGHHGLAWLLTWPGAVWTAGQAPMWAAVAGLLGAVLLVLPAPRRLRWPAALALLPLLWPFVPRPAPGQFELLAADIGQGTAVLLRTRHHLLVYDTGPRLSRESDAGQRVLLPLLRARAEPAIDLLMLSHGDADHIGGAASLLAGWPVRALSSSLPAGHALRPVATATTATATATPHGDCVDGQQWQWDGVQLRVLHPDAATLAGTAAAQGLRNARSCVLAVRDAAGRQALLTGDIEAAQEAALLARHGAPALASTLLLVPHHGSRTSSTPAFLDAVAPSLAVVQAGYRSRFGHPAPDVRQRYADRRIMLVRSDRCGAFRWQAGAVSCTRKDLVRYWHWPAPEAGPLVALTPPSGAPTP
jgi:competence protein ComEC